MRSNETLFVVLAVLVTFVSCTSSTGDKTPSKNSAANAQNIANGNTNVVSNGTFVPAQTGDANAVASVDAPPEGLQPPGMMQKRMDQMRQAGGSSEKVDVAALALRNARPAPDNSTFTSYLAEAGYEIRTFKDHPQLSKVEKKTENNGNQTLKIFLRNGQVIQRPGKEIPALSTAAAADILAVGGITPAPAGPSSGKKNN